MGLGSLTKRIIADTSTIGDGDNIAAYLADSAGNFLTSTLVGSNQALDVNIVQITGQYAEDSAHTTADIGSFMLSVRSDAAASTAGTDGDYAGLITDASGKLWVTGTFAEDSAHTSGDLGLQVLAVRSDAGGSLVSADGDYTPLSIDSSGNLRVSGAFGAEKAEDSAHSSGDTGNYMLAVRHDTAGTQVSADGDYASVQQTADGYIRALGISETSILQQVVSVGLTATAIPATALANRKHILIQNVGGGLVYIGSATVTTSGATQGIVLSNGGTYEADLGPDIDVYGITAGSAKDVAVLETA